jgi:hypothetical protein
VPVVGSLRKPEPLMQNPFSHEGDAMDRPAYMRK